MKVNLSKVNIQLQLCSRVLVLGKKKEPTQKKHPNLTIFINSLDIFSWSLLKLQIILW